MRPPPGATRSAYRLGVDLGTTYTAAAVWRAGQAEVVPLGDRTPQVPSALFRTDDGAFLVGEAALRRGVSDPGRLATEFKRRVGDETSLIVGGAPIAAHVLMAQLLASVLDRVATGQGGLPEGAVVTHPANWGPFRTELLEQAVRMTDAGRATLCSEPEAAAIHFAATERVDIGELVAVYDLGGGTFDAAVLRKDAERSFTILGSPEGIEHLGGLDLDAAVLEHVWRSVGPLDADPDDEAVTAALARLRRECTEAREVLSVDTEVSIPVALAGLQRTVRLSRDELEEMIRPTLELTVASLERALASAGVTAPDLAAVVLVGGAARTPLVIELVTEALGRPVDVSAQPKHCVALGAAMLGAPARAPAPTRGTARATAGDARTAASARTASTAGATPVRTDTVPGGPASEPRPVSAGRAAPARRRQMLWTAAALGALALGTALLAPAAGDDAEVTARLDPGRETAELERGSAPVPEESVLQLTVAGLDVPSGRGRVVDGKVDLSGARAFTAGPLHAVVTPGTGAGSSDAVVLPSDGAPWPRLATIPGAAFVLGLLFTLAYAESLLRPLVRRRTPLRTTTVVAMGGVGLLLGVVVTIGTWILAARLLHPGTVVAVVVLFATAGALLPLALGSRTARKRP